MSEPGKPIESQKPQSGSQNLPIDKTKIGGKQANQLAQASVSNDDARKELLGIQSIVSVLT